MSRLLSLTLWTQVGSLESGSKSPTGCWPNYCEKEITSEGQGQANRKINTAATSTRFGNKIAVAAVSPQASTPDLKLLQIPYKVHFGENFSLRGQSGTLADRWRHQNVLLSGLFPLG